MGSPRLDPQHTVLLVIDIQKKLLPHIHNAPEMLRRAGRLIDGFRALKLPIVATEQYSKGLGQTVPQILRRFDDLTRIHEKMRFSACVEPVMSELQRLDTKSVVVCGIEAHVCVMQTVLGLLDAGLVTAVTLDAVGSRRESDQEVGVQRMLGAGALPVSVESALFELTVDAEGERFRALRKVIT
jgi:nicotinamidase-related amidase